MRVLACNFAAGTPSVSQGAKAYLVGWSNGDGGERRIFLVRSRGGRWIRKWHPTKRMTNFRLTTVTPEDPLYRRLVKDNAPGLAEREAHLFVSPSSVER